MDNTEIVEEIDKSLAIRLKELRSFLGMTQEQYAKVLGVHTPRISTIESGKSGVRPTALANLAQFDVSMDWLLTGIGEPFRDKKKSETYASSLVNGVRRVPTPSLDKIEKDTVPLSLYQTMKAERDRLFDMVDRLTRQLGKYKGVATSTVLAYIGHKIGRTLAMLA